MNILLTNDDGYFSAGLTTLIETLSGRGHDLYLLAPSQCRSATSMSLTLGAPMKLTPLTMDGIIAAFSSEGTSVDCVKMALCGLAEIPRPDVVVSGVNLGLNVARDLHYSATVGAAVEACLSGIPAIAISAECDDNKKCRLHDAHTVLAATFDDLYAQLKQKTTCSFANINLPITAYHDICYTSAASDLVYDDRYSHSTNGYELVGARNTTNRDHSTDLGAINDGYASISILTPQWN